MTPELKSVLERELVLDVPDCLQGWTDAKRGIEMAELVLEHRPETVVEIGCFGGRSTIALALACRENGFGKIYTIDPWKKEATLEGENEANRRWWESVDLHWVHKTAMEAFWRLNLDDWIVTIRSASQRVPHLFPEIHFLLIDGCHSEVASCRDVDLYFPMVPSGGIVWFDDADWQSTQKALSMLDCQCDLIKDGKSYRTYRKR